jgi:hypothetical protein
MSLEPWDMACCDDPQPAWRATSDVYECARCGAGFPGEYAHRYLSAPVQISVPAFAAVDGAFTRALERELEHLRGERVSVKAVMFSQQYGMTLLEPPVDEITGLGEFDAEAALLGQ